MVRRTPPPLLLLLAFGLVAASASASASDDGAGRQQEEQTLTARLFSLWYVTPIDPTLVLSHSTKMRWSKPRHRRGFDPANPSHSLGEEEDEDLRPTLARTLARRLSREAFSGLAERLSAEEGRRVMAWRGEGEAHALAGRRGSDGGGLEVDLRDLEPTCRFSEGKERRYGVETADSDSDADVRSVVAAEETREIEQTCAVNFGSLLPYYGVGFDLYLTLHERPMDGLTPDQVHARLTPDHRGWTQPVRSAEVTVRLTVQSPDSGEGLFGGGGVGLGNAPPELMEEARKRRARVSNAERAVDRLVARADTVLNVGLIGEEEGRKVEKENLGSRTVTVTRMPDHRSAPQGGGGSGMAGTAAGGAKKDAKDEEVPADVRGLCREHSLSEAQCRRAWELMREDLEKAEAAAAQEADEDPLPAEPEAEAEAEPAAEEPRQKKRLPVQSDEELEAEMDAWMAKEAAREERERIAAEQERRRREKERRRLEAEARERELDEALRRREEGSNAEAERMLREMEEAQERRRRSLAARKEGEEAGRGGEERNEEEEPLPTPSLPEESAPPEAGPVYDAESASAGRDEL